MKTHRNIMAVTESKRGPGSARAAPQKGQGNNGILHAIFRQLSEQVCQILPVAAERIESNQKARLSFLDGRLRKIHHHLCIQSVIADCPQPISAAQLPEHREFCFIRVLQTGKELDIHGGRRWFIIICQNAHDFPKKAVCQILLLHRGRDTQGVCQR